MSASDNLQERVDAVGTWFHRIDLGDGVVTPGHSGWTLEALEIPDLAGKSVLDIGAWDGYFSFEAERAGASRVVALDHYVWSLDMQGWNRHQAERAGEGRPPMPAHEVPGLWRPDQLPGKRGFDLAREALDSRVEDVVADFMEVDLADLDRFDIVFYLGVLYHMENPLEALRRVRQVTGELAVIETQCVRLDAVEGRPMFEFFPGAELAGDPSNWWCPNKAAVEALCRAAGFAEVSVVETTEALAIPDGAGASYFRCVLHARP
jgi:tRNA (mo5U34)-methyltransferase